MSWLFADILFQGCWGNVENFCRFFEVIVGHIENVVHVVLFDLSFFSPLSLRDGLNFPYVIGNDV